MQALPWLPRPLIIFAMICDKVTPCVQWHGQDSEGNVTDEQMLFPIYGKDSEIIECVRPEYWTVAYLGCISTWNEKRPNGPHLGADHTNDAPFIQFMSNEIFSHETFQYFCPVIQLGKQGVLYSPQTYENLNAPKELPRHGLDSNIQDKWRKAYLNPDLDIKKEVERVVDLLDLFPEIYSPRYHHWLRTGRVWPEQRW
jgi:hypothetical protein